MGCRACVYKGENSHGEIFCLFLDEWVEADQNCEYYVHYRKFSRLLRGPENEDELRGLELEALSNL